MATRLFGFALGLLVGSYTCTIGAQTFLQNPFETVSTSFNDLTEPYVIDIGVAYDPDGNCHIAYGDGARGVFVTSFLPGGTETVEVVPVEPAVLFNLLWFYDIAFDAAGNAGLVVGGKGAATTPESQSCAVFFFSKPCGGEWSDGELVTSQSSNNLTLGGLFGTFAQAQILFVEQNSGPAIPLVVFAEHLYVTEGRNWFGWMTRGSGGWGNRVNILSNSTSGIIDFDAKINPLDTARPLKIAYSRSASSIRTVRFFSSSISGSSVDETVHTAPGISGAYDVSLDFDASASNTPHIAFELTTGTGGYEEIYYTNRSSGSWAIPTKITNTTYSPNVNLGDLYLLANGQPKIIFTQHPTNPDDTEMDVYQHTGPSWPNMNDRNSWFSIVKHSNSRGANSGQTWQGDLAMDANRATVAFPLQTFDLVSIFPLDKRYEFCLMQAAVNAGGIGGAGLPTWNENFNDATYSPEWTVFSGAWSAASQSMENTTLSSSSAKVTRPVTSSDEQRVRASFMIESGSTATVPEIQIELADPSIFGDIIFEANLTSIELSKPGLPAVSLALKTGLTLTTNTWYVCEIVRDGTNVDVYFGKPNQSLPLMLSTTVAPATNTTKVELEALPNTLARFDNVVVWSDLLGETPSCE